MTREPGDLPSTWSRAGTLGGVHQWRSHRLAESGERLWFAVTCHVAARPEKSPVHAQIWRAVSRSPCFRSPSSVACIQQAPSTATRWPSRLHCRLWSSRRPVCRHRRARSAAASPSSPARKSSASRSGHCLMRCSTCRFSMSSKPAGQAGRPRSLSVCQCEPDQGLH